MKKDKREIKPIPDLRTMVISSAEAFGDKALYIYKDKETKEECSYSYTLLKEEVEAAGTALEGLDLIGSHIAVISETSPKTTVIYFASVNTNGVIVPLDRELDTDQIVKFLNRAHCRAIVYSSSFTGMLTSRAAELPELRYYIPMNGTDEVDASLPVSPVVLPWEDFLAIGKQMLQNGDTSYLDRELDPEKMCAILFTSGTTGTAKGVMLSHKNLAVATYASDLVAKYDSNSRSVSVLPQNHTFEMVCAHLGQINLGCSLYINDSLKYTVRNFQYFKPNSLNLVPLFVETIYKKIWDSIRKKGMEDKVRKGIKYSNALLKVGIDIRRKLFAEILDAVGGELSIIICGGAPIDPEILRGFHAFGIEIYEGYGITECSPLVACNPYGAPRYGSCGKPVYGVTVRIDKTPDEETGEILVKGDNVMLGYYEDEEATKAAFTEDGFFRTGDIGYQDKDGYLYITGRKKNVIILSNGKNVFPEELEEHLAHCELIKESVVLGRKQDSGETVITALIYPDPEQFEGKTPEEIEEAIREAVNKVNRSLPTYKHMSDVEIRDSEFEKTTTKKIKRFLYH